MERNCVAYCALPMMEANSTRVRPRDGRGDDMKKFFANVWNRFFGQRPEETKPVATVVQSPVVSDPELQVRVPEVKFIFPATTAMLMNFVSTLREEWEKRKKAYDDDLRDVVKRSTEIEKALLAAAEKDPISQEIARRKGKEEAKKIRVTAKNPDLWRHWASDQIADQIEFLKCKEKNSIRKCGGEVLVGAYSPLRSGGLVGEETARPADWDHIRRVIVEYEGRFFLVRERAARRAKLVKEVSTNWGEMGTHTHFVFALRKGYKKIPYVDWVSDSPAQMTDEELAAIAAYRRKQ